MESLENISTKNINVIFYIGLLPSYGYNRDGGAQLVASKLISTLSETEIVFKPTVLVQHTKDPNQPDLPNTIAGVGLDRLIAHLKANNYPQTILHLADSQLLLYHPESLAEIASFWKGPILQRLTQLDRIRSLREKLGTGLAKHLSQITMFVSQSHEITNSLVANGVKPERITLIPNGVDTKLFCPAKTMKEKLALRRQLIPEAKPESLVFSFAGRLESPKKRVADLIHAWGESKLFSKGNILLLIGPYEKGIPGVESMAGLKALNIILTGFVNDQTVAELHRAADIFVLPSSIEGEGFSNAMLEAQASGLPTICRQGVSGSDLTVFANHTGLTFSSQLELIEVLIKMADSKARSLMAHNSVSLAHTVYTRENLAKNHFNLYKRLIS